VTDPAIGEPTPAPARALFEVVDYDPSWPATFAAIRDRVGATLGPVAVAIEHVGSTSVPGLPAKPVIDIDVVVADRADIPVAIAALASIGYVHLGTLGVPDREAFRRPPDSARHNLYVCPADGEGLRNHLALRRHLRTHPAAVVAYGALKRRLAAETDDIDVYVAGKTDLIVSLLRAEGIDEETLASIALANRLTGT
jgi:GrpB-like predicted nucleotidyltransferase (UPF0157 family)